MKLTIDHHEEEKKSFFKKSTIYFLDINFEFSPEELALIKKHNWKDTGMCTAIFEHTQGLPWTMVLKVFTEGPKSFGFKDVGELSSAESQVVNNAKILKGNLEGAAGFTSGGPREIEL